MCTNMVVSHHHMWPSLRAIVPDAAATAAPVPAATTLFLAAPCLARDLKPSPTNIAAIRSRALKATTSVGLRNHEEPYDAAHYEDLGDPAPVRQAGFEHCTPVYNTHW